MTVWIHWHETSGATHEPKRFAARGSAEHYIEARLEEWARALEHRTGVSGWDWDTARQVATLYRGDWDIAIGDFTITTEEPDTARPTTLEDRPGRAAGD